MTKEYEVYIDVVLDVVAKTEAENLEAAIKKARETVLNTVKRFRLDLNDCTVKPRGIFIVDADDGLS